MPNKRYTVLLFILIIMILAAFFRLWQLDTIPPGLYPDEAINGNDALATLKSKNFKIFYPENNGREGLFIWIISVSFSLFGVSVWSLKIVPAIIGILTVIGLYLLTKELFQLATSSLLAELRTSKKQATGIALLSSFFLATSFWHINFSRIGFRAILIPFILVFSLYFLLKGFQDRSKFYFIIAGVFFGLGFYTYTVFRLAVLLVITILSLFIIIGKRQNLKTNLFLISCFLLATFITVLPLGLYFIENPQDFIGRTSQISIFSQPDILKSFGKSLTLHLGMFNFYGDNNWRHNLSDSPQLFWPVGILFLIGVAISIKKLIFSIKDKRLSLVLCHLSLLTWFSVMLLPATLTIEGIPHALRSIGVLPVVYIFAGLSGYYIYDWLREIRDKKGFVIFCSLFFILLTFIQFNKYFISWAQNTETKNAFSKNLLDIGNYLNSLSVQVKKNVIVNLNGVPVPWPEGIPMPAQTIMFIENSKYGKIQSLYLLPEDIDKVKIEEKPTVFILINDDPELLEKIKIIFPEGKVKKEKEILTYQINL